MASRRWLRARLDEVTATPPADSQNLEAVSGVALVFRADGVQRALGTRVRLQVRPRFRVRFTFWTESGVESVSDVAEVLEDESAYLVLRLGGRFPLRLPREQVVRQRTEAESWYEVSSIERA